MIIAPRERKETVLLFAINYIPKQLHLYDNIHDFTLYLLVCICNQCVQLFNAERMKLKVILITLFPISDGRCLMKNK